jgi:S-DNA-T family DNA segregation ATPase FtsK/SpoIIIE
VRPDRAVPPAYLRPYLGRDEWGVHRYLELPGVTGITVGGLPGSGKTTFLLGLLAQLAAHGCVQLAIIDGKGGGDYLDWRDRAWLYTEDDLGSGAAALGELHGVMRSRLGRVRELTGHTNGWHTGPTPAFPLMITIVDECHTFMDLESAKGDRDRQAEQLVRQCRRYGGELVRKSRAALMITIFATQKQTADAIPTAIRDNCKIRLSFGVQTRDAAVAALGELIRDHPAYCPTTLQDPAYVGVATAALRTASNPFVRVRVPYLTEAAAADRAAATAHLRRDPRTLLPPAADAA